MRLFGKEIDIDNSVTSLDSWKPRSLPSTHRLKSPGFALSPYRDKADTSDSVDDDKATRGSMEGDERTVEDFWEDFFVITRVCLLRNPDADLYDVFDTIRTKFLGGWGYTEEFCKRVDEQIEREEQRVARKSRSRCSS